MGKVTTEKTRFETLEEIADSLHKIMSEFLGFRHFLHDEARSEVQSLEHKYRGKRDSEWTLEDIKEAEKLIAFWAAEIPCLQEAIKAFTDVRERCPRIKRKQ